MRNVEGLIFRSWIPDEVQQVRAQTAPSPTAIATGPQYAACRARTILLGFDWPGLNAWISLSSRMCALPRP